MPKNVIIAIVVILILGGGAALFFQNQNKTVGENVTTSIKDALSKSVSMECTYTNTEVGESKTYLKNGAVRSDYAGKVEGQGGSVIVTDKKMYMWNGKEGMMMDIPEVTGTPAAGESNTQAKQKDDFVNDLEKYKESCKPAVVSDSLFTPPSDVEFKDYSQMMQQAPPAQGTGVGMTEEQAKEYMKKYGAPTGY